MQIRFVAPDLNHLDQLETEVLVVSIFADQRPLQGLAGLVDWRLCGRLSDWILEKRISGDEGEKLMLPGRPKLKADRVLAVGLGPEGRFDESRFRAFSRAVVQTLDEAHLSSVAISLPPIELAPEKRLRLFLDAVGDDALFDELIVFEPASAHRGLNEIVERERRRARAKMA